MHPRTGSRSGLGAFAKSALYLIANWAVLLASQGIRDGDDDLVDIETQAPIASKFDMKQIAPNRKGSPDKGLTLDTPMGKVDVSHVMAGLDAVISGSPADYPEDFLEELEENSPDDYDTYKSTAVHEALQSASGGDVRDFATWAGDLGQAYAHFLAERYLKKNDQTTLKLWADEKSPREQLLGDIHGYIIRNVWLDTPNRPAGSDNRISNVLRDMYLLPKATGVSYAEQFTAVSGKPVAEHRKFITERTIAFARGWFAKESYALDNDDHWTGRPSKTIAMHMAKFDDVHAEHEASGRAEDKLEVLVEGLLNQLAGGVK